MTLRKCLLLLLPGFLLACNAGGSGSNNSGEPQRFDIEAYKAVEESDDISGIWMMIQTGVRNQILNNGYRFRVSGNIREIIEIKEEEEGGNTVYYQRNCLEPLKWQEIDINGNHLATVMGDHYMGSYQLSVYHDLEQRRMHGKASHKSEDIEYNATVDMKKIATSARSFGEFDFYTLNGDSETYTANCFQEAGLRTSVTTSGGLYLSRSEVHFARMTHRQSEQQYRQAGYLITLSGSPDENYMEFITRNNGEDPALELYPKSDDQGIYVNNIAAGISRYNARFGISGLFDGKVQLRLD